MNRFLLTAFLVFIPIFLFVVCKPAGANGNPHKVSQSDFSLPGWRHVPIPGDRESMGQGRGLKNSSPYFAVEVSTELSSEGVSSWEFQRRFGPPFTPTNNNQQLKRLSYAHGCQPAGWAFAKVNSFGYPEGVVILVLSAFRASDPPFIRIELTAAWKGSREEGFRVGQEGLRALLHIVRLPPIRKLQ